MARIACAWVPELAVTAVVRARPELRDAPLAITDGRAAHSVVIAASAAARATGVRDGMTAAHVAARESGGVRVVPRAEEHAFLAPLAVELLDPDPETRATLASWGVTRIGDLARLPAGELAHRLGPAGALLARRARGEDDEVLRCRPTPTTLIEAI